MIYLINLISKRGAKFESCQNGGNQNDGKEGARKCGSSTDNKHDGRNVQGWKLTNSQRWWQTSRQPYREEMVGDHLKFDIPHSYKDACDATSLATKEGSVRTSKRSCGECYIFCREQQQQQDTPWNRTLVEETYEKAHGRGRSLEC